MCNQSPPNRQQRNPSISLFASTAMAVLIVLVVPQVASAQIGIEGLLGSVTDVSISGSCWDTRSESLRKAGDCPSERSGYGVEVIWALKTIPIGRKPNGPAETSWEIREKRETFRNGRGDTTTTIISDVKVTPPRDHRNTVLVELGLGYGQFSGFESADPAFELRGVIRETPALTLYGTYNGGGVLDWANPYLGLRTGLIQLHNVQLFSPVNADTAIVFAGSAQNFQLGGVAGLAVTIRRVSILAEYAYILRRFGSVQWAAPGANRIPAAFPRELNFTGPTVSFGVQVNLREPK